MITTKTSLTLTSLIVLSLVIIFNTVYDPISASIGFSLLGCAITWSLVPILKDSFIKANLFGNDLNKLNKPIIPESMGVVRGILSRSNISSPQAMLSLQSMIFLGFADDVFSIRWRYKLLLPGIASIPLLMVYYVNFGETHIIMPIPLRFLFGINGVEVGQSLIIAISIVINDLLFINDKGNLNQLSIEAHLFSLYFMLPFIGVSIGLLVHNW
ncbi:10332_t:CDS:2 [Entrophospora sp. SA101]|nr:7320_t:CDS:2 [Entrophospora candida]CAJ0765344.1 10332_t:CDS:2 [Entrophospora sp. SA101]